MSGTRFRETSPGQPSMAPAKLVRGKRRCQRRETRSETWWVQVPRRSGWPPAASASCVVTGDGGTKRRQRLLRPGASIPKETPRGGPRGLRTRGPQGDAVTAWRSPPDRGRWPRHREQKVSPEAGRSCRFCPRNRREWESPAYQGPGPWVGFPEPDGYRTHGKRQAVTLTQLTEWQGKTGRKS